MRTNQLIAVGNVLLTLLLVPYVSAQQSNGRSPTPAKTPAPKELTLRQFRQMFLNQRILILKGSMIPDSRALLRKLRNEKDAEESGSLGGWQPMKQSSDGSFKNDFDKGAFIAYKYKDQTPKVIDIRENAVLEQAKEGQKSAARRNSKYGHGCSPSFFCAANAAA